MIKYKKGVDNVVANALLHHYTLITTFNARLLGFELIRELYASDEDLEKCLN